MIEARSIGHFDCFRLIQRMNIFIFFVTCHIEWNYQFKMMDARIRWNKNIFTALRVQSSKRYFYAFVAYLFSVINILILSEWHITNTSEMERVSIKQLKFRLQSLFSFIVLSLSLYLTPVRAFVCLCVALHAPQILKQTRIVQTQRMQVAIHCIYVKFRYWLKRVLILSSHNCWVFLRI